jgi:hypothetical protein
VEKQRRAVFFVLAAFLALLALVCAGCGTSVLSEPVTERGDAWTITIKTLTDGPDAATTGGFPAINWTPGPDRKFLQAMVEVRNDAKQARDFSWNRCDLDDPQGVVVPSVIISMGIGMTKADVTVTVDPGDSVKRLLVFSVPESYSPKRLQCAPVVFPLPPLKPR